MTAPHALLVVLTAVSGKTGLGPIDESFPINLFCLLHSAQKGSFSWGRGPIGHPPGT